MASSSSTPRTRSITTFGAQWTRFNELEVASGGTESDAWFRQWIGSFEIESVCGGRVAEVGAGVGRSLFNIAQYGPMEIVGYEPSTCYPHLVENMRDVPNCRLVNLGGHEFSESNLDVVFSIGVIHHIPDPIPVVRNIYDSLKRGGHFVAWVYGDQLSGYVLAQKIIRPITNKLNDRLLSLLSAGLAITLTLYGWTTQRLWLRRAPLYEYLSTTFNHLPMRFKKIVIFDQLNPGWSDYYSREDLHSLLSEGGFTDIKIEEKDGYSWTAICTK
jgi:SAM-dependent methyltransferase